MRNIDKSQYRIAIKFNLSVNELTNYRMNELTNYRMNEYITNLMNE